MTIMMVLIMLMIINDDCDDDVDADYFKEVVMIYNDNSCKDTSDDSTRVISTDTSVSLTSLRSVELDDELVQSTEDGDFMLALNAGHRWSRNSTLGSHMVTAIYV